MSYPAFKTYVDCTETEEGDVSVFDVFRMEEYTVPRKIYEFAVQLDGDRDPASIPGYTAEDRRNILRQLRKANLLRDSRVAGKGFGSVYFTLFYKKLNRRLGPVAKIWNNALMLLFLPMAVWGVIAYFETDPLWNGSLWGGTVFGLLLGIALHELSHGMACIAYGGTVHEIGVMIRFFLPGAYVMMKPEEIRHKLQRVQVYAGGVEMNYLLAGIFLLIASVSEYDGFFYMAALNNAFLGLLNSCFIVGLDGGKVIGELLGSGTFVINAMDVLFDRHERESLFRRKYGAAVFVASIVILLSQISLPVLIIDNIISVFEVIF